MTSISHIESANGTISLLRKKIERDIVCNRFQFCYHNAFLIMIHPQKSLFYGGISIFIPANEQ